MTATRARDERPDMRRLLPALIFLFLFFFAAAQPAAAESTVAGFRGNDSTTTTDFEVEGPWLLEWRLDADYEQLVALHVWLVDADTGLSVGRVLRRESRGNGLKLFEQGGNYRLRISSTLARWSLQVRQLTPEEAERYTPRETNTGPRFN